MPFIVQTKREFVHHCISCTAVLIAFFGTTNSLLHAQNADTVSPASNANSQTSDARGDSEAKDLGTVTFETTQKSVIVKRGASVIAEYIFRSGNKPILWPVVGPTGDEMTRRHPMKPGDSAEKKDHPHHRSLWLTHGDVNGFDLWTEPKDKAGFGKKPGCGAVVHQDVLKTVPGTTGTLVTSAQWVDDSDKPMLKEIKTLQFGADKIDGQLVYWVDLDATLTSLIDVNFGDTKEGTFGIRVPGRMKVDAKQGGSILNSRGDQNKQSWGKTAEGVTYGGPVTGASGETIQAGITIVNHPTSYGFPCRWHVRTYGLFAANPFGVHHFVGGDKTKGTNLPAGESIRLRYRVYLHPGGDASFPNHLWDHYKKTP